MAQQENAQEKPTLGEKFREHALGPMGLGSILHELKFALTDIRHKVEEVAYGRQVTPRWMDQGAEGIHGPASDAPRDLGGDGGVHGKPSIEPNSGGPAPARDGDGSLAVAENKPTGPVYPYTPPAEIEAPGGDGAREQKGLGLSYADLSASWEKACLPSPDHGHDHDRSQSPDHGIER